MKPHLVAERQRVIVFLKVPTPGAVKTRLIPALGPTGAASLYRAMVGDLLQRLTRLRGVELELRFAPPGARASIRRWLGGRHRLAPQRGADLGARMVAAFRDAFRDGCSRCVIVGSDVPGLGAPHVARALARLERSDVVLGPSRDGGYYLVGLGAPRPRLFMRMPWSTAMVLYETLSRAAQQDLRVGMLRTLADVDEPADLARLIRRVSRDPDAVRHSPRLAAWCASAGARRIRAPQAPARGRAGAPRRPARSTSSRRAASSR